jgi:hypothetical protein
MQTLKKLFLVFAISQVSFSQIADGSPKMDIISDSPKKAISQDFGKLPQVKLTETSIEKLWSVMASPSLRDVTFVAKSFLSRRLQLRLWTTNNLASGGVFRGYWGENGKWVVENRDY